MAGNSGKSIEHKGFIERITDHSIIVKILSESACSSCHAKGACTSADMQAKEVEVNGIFYNFRPGEMVNLIMEQSLGFRALMLGYVYPFIILFAGLLTASSLGINELESGLLALGLLPPYYFVLFLFRKKIRKSFNFSIRKIE